LKRFRLTPR